MYLPYDQLPDPADKFEIYEEIAQGVNAKVFRAKELDNDRVVALKIQHYDEEHQVTIEEEYHILRDYCSSPNLPEFYGVYKLVKENGPDEIWFVLEVSWHDLHLLLIFIQLFLMISLHKVLWWRYSLGYG